MPPKGARGGGAAGAGGAKKKSKLYKMPEKLKEGTILKDLTKVEWKIGPSIGTGGFGEIYSACKLNEKKYDYVVKCEPHDNGPLFVEMHFYMRNAKLDDIRKFQQSKGLKSLGMPHMVGNGSIEINGLRHRFLVLPRYGSDVNKHFLANGRRLPEGTVYRIAIQMLEVFEFIHDSGYIHADLKAANILLGGGSTSSQVYLLDFGLASHYTTKDFKPDPKKMHNGTIEYTSRDAHLGVATMRSDLEILGYNLIEWLGGQLPWVQEKLLTMPVKVQKSKESFMANLKNGLKMAFNSGGMTSLQPLHEYLNYVKDLEYNERPDYTCCRKIFLNALKSLKVNLTGNLDFKMKGTTVATTNIIPTSAAAAADAKRTKVTGKGQNVKKPTTTTNRKRLKEKDDDDDDSEDAIIKNSSDDDDEEEKVVDEEEEDDDDVFESKKRPSSKRFKGNKETLRKDRGKQTTAKRTNPISRLLDTTLENTTMMDTSLGGIGSESELNTSRRRGNKRALSKSNDKMDSPNKRNRQPLHNFHSDSTINDSKDALSSLSTKQSEIIGDGLESGLPPTSVSASASSAASPSISQRLTKTRSGRTIVNNHLGNKKSNKTYEFNFELDVSIDANVVVNVKRKGEKDDPDGASSKAKKVNSMPVTSSSSSMTINGGDKSGENNEERSPIPRVRVQKFHNREDGRSPQQQPTPKLKLRRVHREV